MKKLLLVIFLVVSLTLGLFVFNNYLSPLLKPSTGRLSVETGNQKSKVYLDNKLIGYTPFYQNNLRVGDHTVAVEADSKDAAKSWRWQTNTTLTTSTLSALEMDLGPNELFSSGENLYFRVSEEGISVITRPEAALVSIDSKDTLKAPFTKGISSGVHTLLVKKDGYLDRQVIVNLEKGFKLNASLYLSANPFEKTVKADNSARATLFVLSNSHVNLADSPESWADGIKYVQGNFTGAETRFDAAIDEAGKVYTFDENEWANKVSSKGMVNIAYLAKKEGESLPSKASAEWNKIKAQFN